MTHRPIALLAALFAALALVIAHAAEFWGGLVPCALCEWERWPYRVVLGLCGLAAILPAWQARLILWASCGTLLAGAALGVVHVGVEFHLWPSPLPECVAPDLSGLSIAERLARMPATPAKPCDEPTFLLPFLPLSMAAMNLLFALAMAVGVGLALVIPSRRQQEDRT
ncbi:MAG: disulfide bond formation protein B [Acetobacteraceae bacterium]|nr:disulfide bond formation protein B [Acetobacteraceae bacterium]